MRLQGLSRHLLLFSLPVVFVVVAFGHLPGDSLLWRELQNSGHILLFTLLAFLILRYLRTSGNNETSPFRIYLIAGCICLSVGITTELVHWFSPGRGFSLSDIIRDLSGISAAIGLYAVFDRQQDVRIIQPINLRRIIVLLVCALLAASLYPLVSLFLDGQARRNAFPTILDMNASWADSFIEKKQTIIISEPDIATCGPGMNHSLAGLRMLPASYPGISIMEPAPDWQAYKYLVFSIFSNRPDPFYLTIRINDRSHNQDYTDRFNRKLNVAHGENRYKILLSEVKNSPETREMDMRNIARLSLFKVSTLYSIEFCASKIRLEK